MFDPSSKLPWCSVCGQHHQGAAHVEAKATGKAAKAEKATAKRATTSKASK